MSDLISRQIAIDAIEKYLDKFDCIDANFLDGLKTTKKILNDLPFAQPEGWVKIPDTGIDDLSDGFHTFRQLYYQRMMLFATIVKQNKDKAWKSLRHEDGELCFGGGWFIVGIDTPEGIYTYHYEDNFYSLFDCEELECAKHWDGHTGKDVTRLLSLPSAQSEQQWIPCSERLPRYNEKVLVKQTHFVNVKIACLCRTHLCNYWVIFFDHEIQEEAFVGKHDMWTPIPSWENIFDEYNENQCEQCIYYHRENNTCQLKKCSTLGGEGYVTSSDMKFCEFCKNKDEVEE